MNKRAVSISSLVVLLALLSFLLEVCLYYFIPQHYITVVVAGIISLALTHFFLESSLSYDGCFLHAAFMTITSVAFAIIVYFLQPNPWIQYDYWILALILVNWLVPFVYCFIRDFADRGPRFDDYLFFFHGMSIVFLVVYAIAIVKQNFITPFVPPYKALSFGAHNFVPFMATGNYLEATLAKGNSIAPMLLYMGELVAMAVPFGFYAKVYCRNLPFILRFFVYLIVPFAVEFAQSLLGTGRGDIDDYTLAILGTLIGIGIYHIVYRVSYGMHKRDFLEDRTVVKSLFHYSNNI